MTAALPAGQSDAGLSDDGPKGPGPRHPAADPGLQPERTALSWRRTIMSAVIATIFIWRGWLEALTGANADQGPSDAAGAGLFAAGHSAQVVGLGVCVMVACLTTVVLVLCAVSRIRMLHAGVGVLESSEHIAAPALMLRTASAAIVALAAATVTALALGV
ncbi:DUF202 domain-containing protein [Specibacter sp. AOP5-B1-6]|uniref:DUF202 domain-containing protein n=1 Tax=Specibacter sp. AOP5-B1-6 TaxID=3457653 RepID=UPI003FB7FA11